MSREDKYMDYNEVYQKTFGENEPISAPEYFLELIDPMSEWYFKKYKRLAFVDISGCVEAINYCTKACPHCLTDGDWDQCRKCKSNRYMYIFDYNEKLESYLFIIKDSRNIHNREYRKADEIISMLVHMIFDDEHHMDKDFEIIEAEYFDE